MPSARRIPRWSDFKPLLSPQRPDLSPTRRRLAQAANIADLRAIARKRTPRAPFDYVDGAAADEISLRRARDLFSRLEFSPSVLRDVSKVDTATTVLGARSEFPFAFAPIGFTRLAQHEGERAALAVAQRLGIPHALSTMGTTSIEEFARLGPHARKWFQLYVWRDRAAGADLVERARASGFEALILTVDTPVGGPRLRDVRNGFAIPPRLKPKTVANAALHPAWWINLLTTEPLRFASLNALNMTPAQLIDSLFDPSVTIDGLEWLRSIWSGPIVVKGIQSVDDAKRVTDAGADAVVLSNHGGRQLDRAPVPLRLLPDVLDVVGDRTEVWVDTGVMNGADIVAAVALGARITLVGRAYMYGLMAGGERGVQRAADILTDDIARTMKLLGVRAVSDLRLEHVRLP